MKNTFIKWGLLIIVVLILALFLASFITKVNVSEGYKNLSNDLKTPGDFPKSVSQAILDDYPLIGKNQVSHDSASDMWWHYPTFRLPSFKQITNNLKYFKNPDIGTCTRPEMCGALYHDAKVKSNVITPLPEVEEGPGARVGYFRSEPNKLFWSIPTNENILY